VLALATCAKAHRSSEWRNALRLLRPTTSRLAGGKLAEVTEYMDTELVTAALGDPA
jgi:hypothetical protein